MREIIELNGEWELHPVSEFSNLWISGEAPAEGWLTQGNTRPLAGTPGLERALRQDDLQEDFFPGSITRPYIPPADRGRFLPLPGLFKPVCPWRRRGVLPAAAILTSPPIFEEKTPWSWRSILPGMKIRPF